MSATPESDTSTTTTIASVGALASSAVATAPAPAARRTYAEQRSLTLTDYLTLFSIGLVVVLVSLPRLRAFALRENELDAIRMLRLLARDAAAVADFASVARAGGLGALLATCTDHRVRLEDLELVGDGRLRRHGYLFDAQPVLATGAEGAIVERWVLRAWPWEHGRTGLGAFEVLPGGEVHGHANESGAFSGPLAPPPCASMDGGDAAGGWVRLAPRADV